MHIKYNKIGKNYNTTRKADPHLVEKLSRFLPTKTGHLNLDIGCGTGNYTIALANKGFSFVGIDPSEKMLSEAKIRNSDSSWLKGKAERIPAKNNVFNGIIATLTIHHWADLEKAFSEIDRVLCNSGKLILFTSTPEQMRGYWLNHYFPNMLNSSINQMPSLIDIQNAIKQTNLHITQVEKYFVKEDLQDCFLYIGKNDPTLYFNETIRNGISSFSSLANIEEVALGLLHLKKDLNNEVFYKIKTRYDNELGDYVFITIEKKE
ncbi:class I SAM-dependent methyltransferase [Pedobacter sp. UBA4863]|uniref:class I SAM-dependent methyltransferase n=1 Tax=Pedobacter sp. UBA4863 TaxID=1947060 RepID=UPI0025E37565|nr:class I SAM-dependent methyltransferase [Pedobacter sp. UBA4863]